MGLYREFHRHFTPLSQDLKKLDLNLNDALILLAVFFENSANASPSDIEKTLNIPKDQISQSLKRLEERHLIQRRISDSGDRRKRFLQITGAGRKLAADLVKIFDRQEDQYENASPRA